MLWILSLVQRETERKDICDYLPTLIQLLGRAIYTYFLLPRKCKTEIVIRRPKFLETLRLLLVALARVAQLVRVSSCKPKRSWVRFPARAHDLVPSWGLYGRQPIDVSHVDVSLPLPLPSLLSKINKHVLRWGFKKIRLNFFKKNAYPSRPNVPFRNW